MRVCHACHSSYDERLTVCPYCGAFAQAGYPAANQQNAKEPISVGGWIGRSLIPYIPLVGSIVYLIMLFIWSGDTKKEETFRNWAKAQLIIMAVVLVLTIVFVLVFGSAFTDLINTIS